MQRLRHRGIAYVVENIVRGTPYSTDVSCKQGAFHNVTAGIEREFRLSFPHTSLTIHLHFNTQYALDYKHNSFLVDTKVKMTMPTDFSRLEASLTRTSVAPRPMSISADHVYRHAKTTDIDVDELDFDFNVTGSGVLPRYSGSLQDLFSVVQWQKHFSNEMNFSPKTDLLDCLQIGGSSLGCFLRLV